MYITKNNNRFLKSLKARDALAWKGGQRRGDVVRKLNFQLSFLSLQWHVECNGSIPL